jgi:hypothetical protein
MDSSKQDKLTIAILQAQVRVLKLNYRFPDCADEDMGRAEEIARHEFEEQEKNRAAWNAIKDKWKAT